MIGGQVGRACTGEPGVTPTCPHPPPPIPPLPGGRAGGALWRQCDADTPDGHLQAAGWLPARTPGVCACWTWVEDQHGLSVVHACQSHRYPTLLLRFPLHSITHSPTSHWLLPTTPTHPCCPPRRPRCEPWWSSCAGLRGRPSATPPRWAATSPPPAPSPVRCLALWVWVGWVR